VLAAGVGVAAAVLAGALVVAALTTGRPPAAER